MTVSPRYDQYKDAWDTDVLVDVSIRSYVFVGTSSVLGNQI